MALPSHQIRNDYRWQMASQMAKGLYGRANFPEEALVSLTATWCRVIELEETLLKWERLSLQTAMQQKYNRLANETKAKEALEAMEATETTR